MALHLRLHSAAAAAAAAVGAAAPGAAASRAAAAGLLNSAALPAAGGCLAAAADLTHSTKRDRLQQWNTSVQQPEIQASWVIVCCSSVPCKQQLQIELDLQTTPSFPKKKRHHHM
jgi:hypothetical protein